MLIATDGSLSAYSRSVKQLDRGAAEPHGAACQRNGSADCARTTADIARSRKRALKLMQAALRIAAKGRRNTYQQVRTNLTRLTPAYGLDQRIAV